MSASEAFFIAAHAHAAAIRRTPTAAFAPSRSRTCASSTSRHGFPGEHQALAPVRRRGLHAWRRSRRRTPRARSHVDQLTFAAAVHPGQKAAFSPLFMGGAQYRLHYVLGLRPASRSARPRQTFLLYNGQSFKLQLRSSDFGTTSEARSTGSTSSQDCLHDAMTRKADQHGRPLCYRVIERSRKMRRRLRDVRAVGHEPAQRPIGALRDADARRHDDVGVGYRRRPRESPAAAVCSDRRLCRSIDPEREAQLSRTIREVDVAPRASDGDVASSRSHAPARARGPAPRSARARARVTALKHQYMP